MNEISWVFFKFFSFKIGHDDEFFSLKLLFEITLQFLFFVRRVLFFIFWGGVFQRMASRMQR